MKVLAKQKKGNSKTEKSEYNRFQSFKVHRQRRNENFKENSNKERFQCIY